jgi:DNA-binding transcriptional MerR regulator
MDTTDRRVTRLEAAALAGVSPRTINRWSASGLITVHRYASRLRRPALYSLAEVLEAARRTRVGRYAPGFESDIST